MASARLSKQWLAVLLAMLAMGFGFARMAQANEEHGQMLFHAFSLEVDVAKKRERPEFAEEVDVAKKRDELITSWHLDGWVGGDYNKLVLKAEGERVGSETHHAEFWAMWSRNIATFWDFQLGLRHDQQPTSLGYLVVGIEGLAPYFFETQVHLFLSEKGDTGLRLRQENHFLLTQRLIMEPYIELNCFAQSVPEIEVGSGLSSGEIGLQLRYEIVREFAPYIDFRYERKFKGTAKIARDHGERDHEFILAVGLRLTF